MSRDRPFDGLPDSVDDYTGSLPSLGGSVPVSGPRGLLLVVLAGLALAWYARPWFQGLAYGLYTSPALVVVYPPRARRAGSLGRPQRRRARPVYDPGRTRCRVRRPAVGGWYAGATLSAETMSETERTMALDESDPENPRTDTGTNGRLRPAGRSSLPSDPVQPTSIDPGLSELRV